MISNKLIMAAVILAVAASVLSAPQGRDPQAVPAQYDFGYEVVDPETGNDFGHAETRNGDNTSGQYRVLLPDGRVQVVSYTVNADSGYVAQVSYQ
ncbi:cuticle protein 8-like [Penaeus japonicus]|uniref:cuticle protein 8-like n=1 Tax=Penaeus japonicus TaxID=27405 RepID=UPI001C714B67|nr:cuticle protein 8-like [Penaeus japonicus]